MCGKLVLRRKTSPGVLESERPTEVGFGLVPEEGQALAGGWEEGEESYFLECSSGSSVSAAQSENVLDPAEPFCSVLSRVESLMSHTERFAGRFPQI